MHFRNHDGRHILSIRVRCDQLSCKRQIFRSGAYGEGGWTGHVYGAEDDISAAHGGTEKFIIGAIASKDDEGACGESEMASMVEQFHESRFLEPLVFPQIFEASAVAWLGQLATACGRRVLFDAVFFCEFHLRVPIASLQVEQSAAIDEAEPFGFGFIEQFGAKGAEQEFSGAGEISHAIQGGAHLRHGALGEHFAGCDEIEPMFLCVGPSSFDHSGVAIDARIEAGPESGGRVFEQCENIGGKIDGMGDESEILDGFDDRAGRRVERGGKDDCLRMDTLFAKNAQAEKGIKATGAKANGAAGMEFRHRRTIGIKRCPEESIRYLRSVFERFR